MQWGLSRRKSKGNPTLRVPYNARSERAAPAVTSPSIQAAPVVPMLSPAPAPKPAPISPVIPPNLR